MASAQTAHLFIGGHGLVLQGVNAGEFVQGSVAHFKQAIQKLVFDDFDINLLAQNIDVVGTAVSDGIAIKTLRIGNHTDLHIKVAGVEVSASAQAIILHKRGSSLDIDFEGATHFMFAPGSGKRTSLDFNGGTLNASLSETPFHLDAHDVRATVSNGPNTQFELKCDQLLAEGGSGHGVIVARHNVKIKGQNSGLGADINTDRAEVDFPGGGKPPSIHVGKA